MNYDSKNDTLDHINKVRANLNQAMTNLLHRAEVHDQSKLEEPEKGVFDRYTPKLKNSTYGSDEYKGFLDAMEPALDHHYAENSHHPEHYPNGIDGMSLLDLLEMLADWKAATQRHADGDMNRSLQINEKRFNISPQLQSILTNTVKEMRW
jgi:hypothetical protein